MKTTTRPMVLLFAILMANSNLPAIAQNMAQATNILCDLPKDTPVGDFDTGYVRDFRELPAIDKPVGKSISGKLIRKTPAQNTSTDLGPYMADMQRSVKRAWSPPKGSISKAVTVVFKIQHNGQLANLHLLNSSGVKSLDEAALKAVENTAPFRPLPEGAPEDIDIKFTFDFNASFGKILDIAP